MSINTRRSNRVEEGKQLLAPKRPSTAYHLFMKEHYDNVAKNNRGLQPLHRTEIMVIIGKMWKALSAEEKKCYEDAVADRWKKYREIFAEYEKNRGLLYHPGQKIQSKKVHNEVQDEVEKMEETSTKPEETTKHVDSSKKETNTNSPKKESNTKNLEQPNKVIQRDLKKMMETVNALKAEISEKEEKIEEKMNEKRILLSQREAAEVLTNQCTETADRWISTILDRMDRKTLDKFGLRKDFTTRQFGDRLVEIRLDFELSKEFQAAIRTLDFSEK